jgi:hypothetical protein
MLLQQPDLVADRRRGDTEFGRGFLETHVPRGSLEGTQLDEGRQSGHQPSVDE